MASHRFGVCEAYQQAWPSERWMIRRHNQTLGLWPATETQAALFAKLIGDLTDEQWSAVKAAVNASLQAAERSAA